MINIINKIRFRLIRRHSLKRLKSKIDFDKEAIYLTFDDGPEPGITEFVLDELKKYNAKATFFCCGENCAKHPAADTAYICADTVLNSPQRMAA